MNLKTPAVLLALSYLLALSPRECEGGSIKAVNNFRKQLLRNKALISLVINSFVGGSDMKNVSLGCKSQISSVEFVDHLFEYLDALGKPGSGVLDGNFYWIGSYGECSTIKNSHYCIAETHFQVPLPLPFEAFVFVGFCVPSHCKSQDIRYLLQAILGVLKLPKTIYIPKDTELTFPFGNSVVCNTARKSTPGLYAALALFGLLTLLCIVATIVEWSQQFMQNSRGLSSLEHRKSSTMSDLLKDDLFGSTEDSDQTLVFDDRGGGEDQRSTGAVISMITPFLSLTDNARKIFSTLEKEQRVSCLNGIIFLSVCWIIYRRVARTVVYAATDNVLVSSRDSRKASAMLVTNGDFAIDSLFVSSALAVSFKNMQQYHFYGNISIIHFYLKRILRVLPVYMATILFYIYVFPAIGDGPMWQFMVTDDHIKACKSYWWTNLFYINNFYPGYQKDLCMDWSWYITLDMQFHVIVPLFLMVMCLYQLRGTIFAVGVTILSSFIITAVLVGTYDLKSLKSINPADTSWEKELKLRNALVYIKPYCRIAPFLVGMLGGYLLHRGSKLRGKLQWALLFSGFITSLTLWSLLIFGTLPYYKEDHDPPSAITNVAYLTCSSFAWGVSIVTLIAICFFKCGEVLNDLLSWAAFVPLRRLSYCAYLVHGMVVYFFYYARPELVSYSRTQVVTFTIAAVVTSYFWAFVLAVIIEYPFRNLTTFLLDSYVRYRF